MKKTGTVYKGPAKPKADVTIILADDTFTKLAEGKLDGQKAFMTGKLKTKGNMMLATKLDGVLKASALSLLTGYVLTLRTGGKEQGQALSWHLTSLAVIVLYYMYFTDNLLAPGPCPVGYRAFHYRHEWGNKGKGNSEANKER